MKENILSVISKYDKQLTREIRTTEIEELEEILKNKGSLLALSSAYYYGFIQALKEKSVTSR